MSREFCVLLRDPVDNVGNERNIPHLPFQFSLGVWFIRKYVVLSVPNGILSPYDFILRLWCKSMVFLFNVNENNEQKEVWRFGIFADASQVTGEQWGSSPLSVAGSIWEDSFLLLALHFFEPLYWKLPQFASQTLIKPVGWCRICKDNACGGRQESRVNRKFQCRVSAGSEVHSGCKGVTGEPRLLTVWQERAIFTGRTSQRR